MPIPGHNVKIIFGDELNLDDLIKAHEEKYGPLWTFSPSGLTQNKSEENKSIKQGDQWISSPEELVLYSKITKRIEAALHELCQGNNKAQLE